MIFNTAYYHPMDRDYHFDMHGDAHDHGHSHGGEAGQGGYEISIPTEQMPHIEPEADKPGEAGFGVRDIGMSVPLGIAAANVHGVQAKIRSGANAIEIQFPGAVRGSRNAQTPEQYGLDQRRALEEVRRANDVRFTTHASFGVMGLSGADSHGNFSWTHQKLAVDEVKKAIEFAADAAGGGSVVVHTGEYERPIAEMPWSRDENGRLMFRKYYTEPDDAQYPVLDDRTGQVISTVQKDRLVARPVWRRAKEDYDGIDQEGRNVMIRRGDYIDYENKKIIDPYDATKGRVPEFDPVKERFKVEMYHFDDFVKEAEERNRRKEKEFGRQLRPDEMVYPEEVYIQATLETQEGHARGWALQYGRGFESYKKAVDKLEDLKRKYDDLKKSMPKEELWKIMKQDTELYSITRGLLEPEQVDPVELIEKQLQETRHLMEYQYQASTAQEEQAKDTSETRRWMVSARKRMWNAGFRGYAEAGIYALEKTKDQKNPVVVTMENIFPDRFGGHPEELMQLIDGARKKMTDLMTNKYIEVETWDSEKKMYVKVKKENEYYKGISREQAERLAEQHIKATIDTGHANLWRKYYIRDPKLSPEQNEQKFKNWLLGYVEKFAKHKMLGNIHLTDNLGYEDEHLSPGQGNTPIKEMLQLFKKYGYKGPITVEPGAAATTDEGDFYGLMQTWRYLGSTVYGEGIGGPIRMGASHNRMWTDVQSSYFGQTYPPYFVFGAYAPSNDWTLWTGVPME